MLNVTKSQDSNPGQPTPELCSPLATLPAYKSLRGKPKDQPCPPNLTLGCKRFLALLLHLLSLSKKAKAVLKSSELVGMRKDSSGQNIRCSLQALIRLSTELRLLLLNNKQLHWPLSLVPDGETNSLEFLQNRSVCYS